MLMSMFSHLIFRNEARCRIANANNATPLPMRSGKCRGQRVTVARDADALSQNSSPKLLR